MSDDPKYDVAISFLAKDEATGRTIADKLEASGFNVFFFPRNQEELAGTNGMETMREPFFESRVSVVLFREPWGQTPWTRVEQTALTERCLEKGWESLIFVQLDGTSKVPKWLPNTHVRFLLEAYGIEQLSGAIKARVQEHGGVLVPLDPMTEAKRVKREADYFKDREALLHDRHWIEDSVHRSLAGAYGRIEALIETANKEHGFGIVVGARGYQSCIMRAGYITLALNWQQPIYNSVMNDSHGDCYLCATEFSGTVPIPGRNEMAWYKPRVLKEHKFRPDVSEMRELVWIERKGERIASDKLADRIMLLLFDLIARTNAGKVPKPDL
ncbi:MAG: TIR domain-containing protein [Xanthobacteraceae bacterium]